MKTKRVWLFLGIFLGSCLLYYYNIVNRQEVYNSDFDYYAIAGKDIMEGNVILRGWHGATNSFYLLSLIYGVFGKIFGYDINLTYSVSAFIWALTVTGISYCTLRQNEGKKQYAALLISLLCVYSSCYLNQSDRILAGVHLDATLLSFIYAWVIAKEREEDGNADNNKLLFSKKYIIQLIIASVCLIIAVFSDALVIYFAVVPILITFFLKLIFTADRNEKPCYIFKLLVTIFNFVIAKVLIKIVAAVGGIRVEWSGNVNFMVSDNLFDRLEYGIEEVLYLFNADFFGKTINIKVVPELMHFLFVLLLGGSFLICIKKIVRNNTFNQILAVIAVMELGVMVFIGYSLTDSIVYRSRIMYHFWIAMILLFSQVDFNKVKAVCKITVSKRIIYIFEVAFILILIAINARWIRKTEQPLQENKIQKIVSILKEKNLTRGYGTFWAANVTTLASGCEIYVCPANNPKDFSKMNWLSFGTEQWDYANFVLFHKGDNGIDSRDTVVDAIGEPDEEIQVEDIAVMIWDKNIMPYIDGSGSSEDIDYWWSILPEDKEKEIEVTSRHFSSKFAADEKGYYTSDAEGQLIYGPYKELQKGKYNAIFVYEYTGDCAPGDVIGYVDAFSLNEDIEYKKADMIAGEDSVSLDDIVLYTDCTKAELRSYVNVPGVTMRRIILQKVDD